MDEPEQPDGATLSDLIEEERVLVFQCSLPCAKLPEDARLAPKQTTELSIPQSWSKRGPMKSALHPSNQPHLGAMPCIASGRLMQRPADKGDTPIRTVNLLSEAELERCFLSLPAAALRTCLVACKAWGLAIRNHPILSLRRLEFEWSGTDYDRQGIVYYLGTMFGSRSMWSNPAKSALLDVKVHSSSRVSGASRKLAGTRHGENVTNVLSHGVSHFQTDGLPFSWVAVDLGDFAISPTHYTLGTSTSLTCFPVTWQLMGAEAAGRSDDLDMWDHWVLLDDVRHADPPFSAARLSATFPAKLPAAHQAYYRYLRVVQVGPNQQFGHNFLISGLEFYGHLRREKDKACAGSLCAGGAMPACDSVDALLRELSCAEVEGSAGDGTVRVLRVAFKRGAVELVTPSAGRVYAAVPLRETSGLRWEALSLMFPAVPKAQGTVTFPTAQRAAAAARLLQAGARVKARTASSLRRCAAPSPSTVDCPNALEVERQSPGVVSPVKSVRTAMSPEAPDYFEQRSPSPEIAEAVAASVGGASPRRSGARGGGAGGESPSAAAAKYRGAAFRRTPLPPDQPDAFGGSPQSSPSPKVPPAVDPVRAVAKVGPVGCDGGLRPKLSPLRCGGVAAKRVEVVAGCSRPASPNASPTIKRLEDQLAALESRLLASPKMAPASPALGSRMVSPPRMPRTLKMQTQAQSQTPASPRALQTLSPSQGNRVSAFSPVQQFGGAPQPQPQQRRRQQQQQPLSPASGKGRRHSPTPQARPSSPARKAPPQDVRVKGFGFAANVRFGSPQPPSQPTPQPAPPTVWGLNSLNSRVGTGTSMPASPKPESRPGVQRVEEWVKRVATPSPPEQPQPRHRDSRTPPPPPPPTRGWALPQDDAPRDTPPKSAYLHTRPPRQHAQQSQPQASQAPHTHTHTRRESPPPPGPFSSQALPGAPDPIPTPPPPNNTMATAAAHSFRGVPSAVQERVLSRRGSAVQEAVRTPPHQPAWRHTPQPPSPVRGTPPPDTKQQLSPRGAARVAAEHFGRREPSARPRGNSSSRLTAHRVRRSPSPPSVDRPAPPPIAHVSSATAVSAHTATAESAHTTATASTRHPWLLDSFGTARPATPSSLRTATRNAKPLLAAPPAVPPTPDLQKPAFRYNKRVQATRDNPVPRASHTPHEFSDSCEAGSTRRLARPDVPDVYLVITRHASASPPPGGSPASTTLSIREDVALHNCSGSMCSAKISASLADTLITDVISEASQALLGDSSVMQACGTPGISAAPHEPARVAMHGGSPSITADGVPPNTRRMIASFTTELPLAALSSGGSSRPNSALPPHGLRGTATRIEVLSLEATPLGDDGSRALIRAADLEAQAAQQQDPHAVDPDFSPGSHSLGQGLGVHPVWSISSESLALRRGSGEIFHRRPKPWYVDQGALGDAWLCSLLSALTEKPEVVHSVFRSATQPSHRQALVPLRVCEGGFWTTVRLDRFLPVTRGGGACFARSTEGDLWVALMEKAAAKALGSYAALGTPRGPACLPLIRRFAEYFTGGSVTSLPWRAPEGVSEKAYRSSVVRYVAAAQRRGDICCVVAGEAGRHASARSSPALGVRGAEGVAGVPSGSVRGILAVRDVSGSASSSSSSSGGRAGKAVGASCDLDDAVVDFREPFLLGDGGGEAAEAEGVDTCLRSVRAAELGAAFGPRAEILCVHAPPIGGGELAMQLAFPAFDATALSGSTSFDSTLVNRLFMHPTVFEDPSPHLSHHLAGAVSVALPSEAIIIPKATASFSLRFPKRSSCLEGSVARDDASVGLFVISQHGGRGGEAVFFTGLRGMMEVASGVLGCSLEGIPFAKGETLTACPFVVCSEGVACGVSGLGATLCVTHTSPAGAKVTRLESPTAGDLTFDSLLFNRLEEAWLMSRYNAGRSKHCSKRDGGAGLLCTQRRGRYYGMLGVNTTSEAWRVSVGGAAWGGGVAESADVVSNRTSSPVPSGMASWVCDKPPAACLTVPPKSVRVLATYLCTDNTSDVSLPHWDIADIVDETDHPTSPGWDMSWTWQADDAHAGVAADTWALPSYLQVVQKMVKSSSAVAVQVSRGSVEMKTDSFMF